MTALSTTSSGLPSHLAALSELRSAALMGVRRHFDTIDVPEITVPVLVGITGACENISTLYRLDGPARVHLTQTGQLALEHALTQLDAVYCVTPSFRMDAIDERHLNEFTLVEEELCCDHPSVGMTRESYQPSVMFDRLLEHVEHTVRAAVRAVCDDAPAWARERFGIDAGVLRDVLGRPFERITYANAIEELNESGLVDPLRWGDDLRSHHEATIVDLIAKKQDALRAPVFVTHFPKDIKFFNMRVDDADPRVVLSADLILPGAGESVGSAVREEDYERLLDRLVTSTMFRSIQEQGLASLDDFRPYLDVIAKRLTSPHAGYGLGFERLIQFVIGSADIRASSVSYKLSRLMEFTQTSSAGQGSCTSPGF